MRRQTVRTLASSVLCLAFACTAGVAADEKRPSIDASFPGGNIVVERIQGDDVFLRQDLRDTAGWWFYWSFRVRQAAGRTVRVPLHEQSVFGPLGPAYSLDNGANGSGLVPNAPTPTGRRPRTASSSGLPPTPPKPASVSPSRMPSQTYDSFSTATGNLPPSRPACSATPRRGVSRKSSISAGSMVGASTASPLPAAITPARVSPVTSWKG